MFSQKNKAEDSKTKNKLMFYWKNSQSTHQKGAHTKKNKKNNKNATENSRTKRKGKFHQNKQPN